MVGLISCTTNVTPAATKSQIEPEEPVTQAEAAVVEEPDIAVEPAAEPTEAETAVVEDIATTEVVTAENKLPIFDTHVHYSQDAWAQFSPGDIIGKLEQANVPRALVSSSPDEGTRRLYELDPDRIVPFLRPYHDQVTSGNWFENDTVLPYFRNRLETPIYQGLGEIHLHFDGHADAPIVRETARLAVEQGLYLHVHSNAQAIDTIFANELDARILWAHAGLSEPPEVVSAMMDKHPNLWADISIREYQIAPEGVLDPAWETLFLKHPDRITIGSDTWVPSRWENYQNIIETDRVWLNQLPPAVARQIAYGNAVRLFGAGPHQYLE
jgi:hypothetical protein